MNIHTMLKQKKKKAREEAVRETVTREADNNHSQQMTRVIYNLCPRCGYNMGMYWPSQYCSRNCVYGYDDQDGENV